MFIHLYKCQVKSRIIRVKTMLFLRREESFPSVFSLPSWSLGLHAVASSSVYQCSLFPGRGLCLFLRLSMLSVPRKIAAEYSSSFCLPESCLSSLFSHSASFIIGYSPVSSVRLSHFNTPWLRLKFCFLIYFSFSVTHQYHDISCFLLLSPFLASSYYRLFLLSPLFLYGSRIFSQFLRLPILYACFPKCDS